MGKRKIVKICQHENRKVNNRLVLSEKDNPNFEAEFKTLVGMTVGEFTESAVNMCSSEIAEFIGDGFTIGTSAYTGWWDVYKTN